MAVSIAGTNDQAMAVVRIGVYIKRVREQFEDRRYIAKVLIGKTKRRGEAEEVNGLTADMNTAPACACRW